MTRTGYAAIKKHFDGLMRGSINTTVSGLAQIKDTYELAFGTKIHMYDVYQTSVKLPNNPINKIITLVGEKDDSIKTGIIPCLNDICAVNILDKDYFMGLTLDNVNEYVMFVYQSMCNIMIGCPMYNLSDKIAMNNPYVAFLKVCPFYFTYHHLKYVNPNVLDCLALKEILEKYICDVEDIPTILHSIQSNKYSEDFEDIYKTMTCNGTVEILV